MHSKATCMGRWLCSMAMLRAALGAFPSHQQPADEHTEGSKFHIERRSLGDAGANARVGPQCLLIRECTPSPSPATPPCSMRLGDAATRNRVSKTRNRRELLRVLSAPKY
eukprot:366230-Chlamydomonas_euryale.AAC.7